MEMGEFKSKLESESVEVSVSSAGVMCSMSESVRVVFDSFKEWLGSISFK